MDSQTMARPRPYSRARELFSSAKAGPSELLRKRTYCEREQNMHIVVMTPDGPAESWDEGTFI